MRALRGFTRDLADGLEAVFGPIVVPRWLHAVMWTMIWALWIAGAIGFIYERVA